MLAARHQASGAKRGIVAGQPFVDYILQAQQAISATHTHLSDADRALAIEGNAPFQLFPATFQTGVTKPYRRGIVLTHGLSDSPYFMRQVAEIFQAQGFCVMAVLLPGHGTQPGDLLDVRWDAWAAHVAYAVEQMAAEVEELYLGGYSAGGALSVYHALADARITGLFLFSPALEISSRAAWANLHRFYSGLIPQAKWLDIKADADLYKYESFPKNAAAQMYALTQALKARLAVSDLAIPVFAVQSQDDVTIHADAVLRFMDGLPNAHKKLLYYFSDASRLPQQRQTDQLACIDTVLPERRILSSAHTAIVLPPQDRHYGEQGTYRNCNHYDGIDAQKYQACKRCAEGFSFGEITPQHLNAGGVIRLMYNPHFEALKQSLVCFIDGLPH